MAATVKVQRITGASPGSGTNVDGTTSRQSQSDVASPGTANPIPIPSSGSSYGYWATYRFNANTTPSSLIDNLKMYMDGGNGFGTGVTMKAAKASTGADAGYRRATSAIELTQGNHSGLDAAPADIFGYTSASPLALNGAIANPNTGLFGDHVVVQMILATTAAPGTTPVENMVMQYDEV